MRLFEVPWNPSDRQLRQFGAIALVALPALAWLWTSGGPALVLGAAGLGVAAAVVGWVRPRWLRPVFVGLCLITMPIGMVVSEVVLLVVFYSMFVPLGLLFRVAGRDSLQRKLDPKATSYWQPKRQPSGPASYLRQS